MIIRDRIKELRRVKASDLLPNPKNWRSHPQNQQNVLKGVLAEIGYADALIARETDEGLMLIDGHLRAEATPDADVPVLVLDVNEEEAEKILATLDPLAAMARPDNEALIPLLEGLNFQDGYVNKMLEALANNETDFMPFIGTTPDLDELTKEYGEFDETALYPEIRIKVSPPVKRLFEDWLATGTGETESEKLENLLS